MLLMNCKYDLRPPLYVGKVVFLIIIAVLCVIVHSCSRGWFYHKEHRLWFIRVANVEPLVKTNTYERGSYHCFDPNTWEMVRKVSLSPSTCSFLSLS